MAKEAASARAGGGVHAGFGEEVEQRGVVLVDFAERVFHFADGLVEDGAEDAVLLVGEEAGEGVGGGGCGRVRGGCVGCAEGGQHVDRRGDEEGVGDVGLDGAGRGGGLAGLGVGGVEVDVRGRFGGLREEAIDEADDFGEVGFADGDADFGGEGGEGDLLGGGVATDGGGKVLVAEVEHGVADFFVLFGDAGGDAGAAEGDFAAAGGEGLVGVAVDVEAEELAFLGVVAEDGGDGVVGADLFESDLHAGDVAGVDVGAVPEVGDVGFGLGEDAEELGFEGFAGGAEELGGELEDASGVGDDLDGFDAGKLVEEPAAGGVHELGVALELHELEDAGALGRGEWAARVRGDEAVGGRAIEDDLDVGVAGGPKVVEQGCGERFGEGAAPSRRWSRASRRGLRQRWFQPGLPPLQPQSERQRSTPWEQDQEVSSATSAAQVGGNRRGTRRSW